MNKLIAMLAGASATAVASPFVNPEQKLACANAVESVARGARLAERAVVGVELWPETATSGLVEVADVQLRALIDEAKRQCGATR